MPSVPCRNCGRPTDGRHLECWRCRHGIRGLSSKLLGEPVKVETVRGYCECRWPQKQFIPWFGGYECGRCGHPMEKVDG